MKDFFNNEFTRPFREVGRWFKKTFGKKEKNPIRHMPQNSVSSDPLMAPSPEIPGGFTTGNSGGNGFGLYDFLENLTWALNGGMLYADFNNPRYYTSEAPSQLERPEQLIGALGIQGGAKILSIASNRISKTAPNIANKVKNVLPLGNNAARGSTSLGAARSSIRGYLKNVGNIPRSQLVKDLEGAGFNKVFEGKGMQHFQRGNWKIRLDPPHLKGKYTTPFNHMHINRGGNKNAFDIFLNPVKSSSPGAHIRIR